MPPFFLQNDPGFKLGISSSQNAIYFSIMIPKKSHFTIFAIQNFVLNTKKCEILFILMGSCL